MRTKLVRPFKKFAIIPASRLAKEESFVFFFLLINELKIFLLGHTFLVYFLLLLLNRLSMRHSDAHAALRTGVTVHRAKRSRYRH